MIRLLYVVRYSDVPDPIGYIFKVHCKSGPIYVSVDTFRTELRAHHDAYEGAGYLASLSDNPELVSFGAAKLSDSLLSFAEQTYEAVLLQFVQAIGEEI